MSHLHLASSLLGAALALSNDGATAAPLESTGPCEIAVEVSSTVPLRWSPQDVLRFRRNASEIWERRGVRLCWPDGADRCSAARTTVYVRLAEEVPRAGPPEPGAAPTLGWIGFSDRSGPGSFIVLSVGRASEMLARVKVASRRLGEMSGGVARFLPQALGRVLAHELGHYLLARREHAGFGIMRPALTANDLAANHLGSRGRLAKSDADALSSRCRRPAGTLARAAAR